MTASDSTTPRLEVSHASKTFAGRTVLRDVDLTVAAGELHGLIGQNGSGKSTLAKIISGYHGPDAGTEIRVDGEPVHVPVRLRDLHRMSVSIVYQDLGLIDDASVVQNVRIGTLRRGRMTGRVNWKHECERARPALERLGFAHRLSTPVATLSPADRARVAVARALQEHHRGRGLLVFDESTRALPLDALEDFYGTVRQLLADGTSVLLIGHRLGEILRYCDRVSVLRDGALAASGVPTADLTEAELARLMLGTSLASLTLEARGPASAAVVHVRGLVGANLHAPLDLSLAAGEIVGLTGLPGSGFEAVPYLLAGADRASGGLLDIDGRTVKLQRASVTTLMRHGIVLVPENRLRDGLGRDHDVLTNITLPWLDRHGRAWWAGRRWRHAQARDVIGSLGVSPADPAHLVARLSGGNQQKVLLGKWLAGEPRLLAVHEPTQAVDVKARQDLLTALNRVAGAGSAVVMASSEVADLATLCDRVLVFRDGVVAEELVGDLHEDKILEATYRGTRTTSVAAG
jgi:ribose transport system ATP-binding protein